MHKLQGRARINTIFQLFLNRVRNFLNRVCEIGALPHQIKAERADIRSVAKFAKTQGAHVKLPGDRVTINSITYTHDTLPKIPERFSLAAARTISVNPETIGFYSKHSVFSNFAPVNVEYQGSVYSSVEQCYQVLYAKDAGRDDLIDKLMDEHDGIKLKRLANGITQPPNSDWSNKRERVMYDIVLAKFRQNPNLMTKLKTTGTVNQEEATADGFWGAAAQLTSTELRSNTWKGQNNLGKILMRVRSGI